MLALCVLTAGWFAWRAANSPVAELGMADLLLLGGAVGSFVVVRSITENSKAEAVLAWGIAVLLLAAVWVAGKQLLDPAYSPVFRERAGEKMVSGFAAHYNEGANFFIGASLLVAGAAMFGRHSLLTRIVWLVLAVAGLACVYFTNSRGGVFGAAVGCGVLAALALIVTRRRKSRWFGPAVIAVPLVLLGIGALWIYGWQEVQQARTASSGRHLQDDTHLVIQGLLDNNARLFLLGLAVSCIGLHPLAGGGSRSFSWECFRFAEGKDQGDTITHLPDLVHNEFIQAATDYGIIGAGLLACLLIALTIALVLHAIFEERPREPDARDAWRLGGAAAMAGMLVQSCFSFVFHLMPGVILLGICLGMMSRANPRPAGAAVTASRSVLTLVALCCLLVLLPFGWKGSQLLRILWPVYFSKTPQTTAESRLDALDAALRVWPQSPLYLDRAVVHTAMAGDRDDPEFAPSLQSAVADYQRAARLHAFDPVFPLNRANLLSRLERDAEAEQAFDIGIRLQGGMEPAFRGHLLLANHLLRKGLRQFEQNDAASALASLEQAAEEIESAATKMHWVTYDMVDLRVSIHESLGTAREAAADREGALAAYDYAATLPRGRRANYRAAVLLGKMAVEAWSQRRAAEAMGRFIAARKRVNDAGNEMPAGVSAAQRVEYIDYLDRTIAFLKGARIAPE